MAIAREGGDAPPTCPWQAFRDPVVRDVIELYQTARADNGAHVASILPLNPPHHLWEGVRYYATAISLGLAAKRARQRKKAEDDARKRAGRR